MKNNKLNIHKGLFFWLKSLFKPKHPRYVRNLWYNRSVHLCERYPKVFEGKDYIPCTPGQLIAYKIDEDGKEVYYKVIRMWYDRPWADWLYGSDSIRCDLKFSHIEK